VPVPPPLGMLAGLLVAGLLLAPTAGAAPAAPRTPIAARDCPGRDLVPTADDLGAVRAAIVCLHSQIRVEHGLPSFAENATLRRAATAHSTDMVASGYFEHTGPSGTTLVDRLFGAHYVGRNQTWVVGENLAWATGVDATPASVMRLWMASPGHRANILRRSYRDVGVGIVTGVPSDGTAGATFTADFGGRR
jgi:uncharacterized protein YkwD